MRPETLTAGGPDAAAAVARPFVPKPVHQRYLRAYLEMLEEAGQVNVSAWAEKLGITRQAIWKFRGDNPGFDPWLNEQLERAAEAMVGAVIKRMGAIAVRTGSPAHAEIFLKALQRIGPDAAGLGTGGLTVQVVNVPSPAAPGAPAWPGGFLEDKR